MAINATESVFKRIKYLISKQDNNRSMLRISVDSGGCSGFQYEYKFVNESNDEDYIIENSEGVKIVIDSISKQYMDGCTIDFIQELGNEYFTIKNPNATNKCGCGNSFSI